jgi:hypothetical protein
MQTIKFGTRLIVALGVLKVPHPSITSLGALSVVPLNLRTIAISETHVQPCKKSPGGNNVTALKERL